MTGTLVRPYAVRRDRINNRPNDGSGAWPDFSNTGYVNAPGYPGSVTNYTTGMTATGSVFIQEADNTTLSYKRFLGKSYLGYLGVGDNLTFYGCLFEGTWPNDNLVQLYPANSIRFLYCTFKPASLSTPPGNNGTITSARTSPGTPYASSWQYISGYTVGQYVTFDHCDIWGNAGLQCTGGQDAAHPGRFTNCYIHDQADNDSSGGGGYHHDGIGPDSEGGSHDTIIDNCTIASIGNTNAVALQGSSTYNRIQVTNCYLSGFGYNVSIGATTPWSCTNITVSDNVLSAELPMVFGPLYGNLWNSGGGTNTWRRNRYQVRSGDGNTNYSTSDHSKYWWPSDNVSHASDYTG